MKAFTEGELAELESRGTCLPFLAEKVSALFFPQTKSEAAYVASRFSRLIAAARASARVAAFLGTHQDSLLGIVMAAEESARNDGKRVLAEERRVVKEALLKLLKELNQE